MTSVQVQVICWLLLAQMGVGIASMSDGVLLRAAFEAGFLAGRQAVEAPVQMVGADWWERERPGGLAFVDRPDDHEEQWRLAMTTAWRSALATWAKDAGDGIDEHGRPMTENQQGEP